MFATIPVSGPLAHAWLEQRTHNPLVPCSTHGRPTKILCKLRVARMRSPFFIETRKTLDGKSTNMDSDAESLVNVMGKLCVSFGYR